MIRRETQQDYHAVEAMIKKAFWNVNVPGCDEHYLAHVLRSQPDFIPELDLVIEEDGRIIANVMYARSTLVDEAGNAKAVLTFGPLSVLPEYQRRGHGKRLLAASFEKALELGYDAVVIFGNPENYVSSGFKGCQAYNVSLGRGFFPVALLVRELKEGALAGHRWTYIESPAYGAFDPRRAEAFDKGFEPMEKAYRPSQELFSIYSRSSVRAEPFDGCDMLASLTRLPAACALPAPYKLKRAFPGDKEAILAFIETQFHKGWAYEAEHALMQEPGKVWIVTENGRIVGFACYDASAKGFFGPIGVLAEKRGQGIGRALLIRTLEAMRDFGYAYAVIGWVSDAAPFYRKVVGAEWIPGGEPENSVYANRICQ